MTQTVSSTDPPTPSSTRPITRPTVVGAWHDRFEEILTPEALDFLARLDNAAAGRRADLLAARRARAHRIRHGEDLDFLPGTGSIRRDPSWQVAPPAPGLTRRRVEMTGPVTRRMTINALNSGADVWMADFEDATAPAWQTVIDGQLNLLDAIRDRIEFTDDSGREYRVVEASQRPTIVVRPRGWRLCEKHLTIDGRPMSASLVDFGLFFFHNARELIARGAGPYCYLPKLESHLEARLWNDVFVQAQALLGIPQGTIRATVLIETLPAAFEMDEILYELRDHSAGLNAGRWDYLFSRIKTFAQRGPEFVLPERAELTMTIPTMRAYTDLLVATCHRRGAHAIGGMAAFVPSKADPQAAERALTKMRADKDREAADGFDGSWAAHPALVPTCRDAFEAVLQGRPDQRDRQRDRQGDGVAVTATDLIGTPTTTPPWITLTGLRTNVSVSLRYLTAWVSGQGAVAIDSLMEDAATVEISRAQVWQWLHHRVRLAEGLVVTRDLVTELMDHEVELLHAQATDDRDHRHVDEARDVFVETALGEELPAFFTPYAYVRYLVDRPLQPAQRPTAEDLRRSEVVRGHEVRSEP
ncbi:malate synthase A [Nakamurella leprariae]|uniref:Malate synthase n=1 Tax=Nakamurella leprariae TaxID=2803911 RepID=A0A939C343_9ACTN|nr:malate synthase A [Nakamurella leprariae]MBM9468999.1 malate synthase A [Nakamurella leprariae]